jgi:hypothetical protein
VRRLLAFAVATLFACSTVPRLDAQLIVVRRGPIVAGGAGGSYVLTRDANASSAFANTFDVTIAPAVGETMIVNFSNPDVSFTPSVTDNAGTPNTYTLQATTANFPDNYRMWVFTSKITHAGASKITITGSNSGQNTIAYIAGYTGITSATIVGSACSDAHASGTTLSCTLSSLPGSAPYFIVGYAFSFGGTVKPGTGMSGGQVAWSAGSTCPGPAASTLACPLYKTLSSGSGTTVDATAVSGDNFILGFALQ